jgi:hypothetical protein
MEHMKLVASSNLSCSIMRTISAALVNTIEPVSDSLSL